MSSNGDYHINYFFDNLNCSPELIPARDTMEVYNNMHDCIYTKDINSRYCFVNKQHFLVAGYSKLNRFSGKLDADLCWQEYGHIYKEHDKDAMNGLEYRQLALAKTPQADSLIITSFKKPIYDSANIPIGLMGVTHTYQHRTLQELYSYLRMPADMPLKIMLPDSLLQMLNKKSHDLKPLTAREMEVLFYLLQGKSPKTLAKILELSVRTINHHIENIKIKWSCFSTEAIHAMAYESGYFNCIPASLFNARLLMALKVGM